MKGPGAGAFSGFKGLHESLSSVREIHSYTMDLGFALGLLEQCNGRDSVEFHVDSFGYRPAALPAEEWHKLAGTHKFLLKPQSKRPGVFHSKAWLFEKGLLLGSCNLSTGEARNDLNFWCWIPEGNWQEFQKRVSQKKSCTVYWDLDSGHSTLKSAPLAAVKAVLKKAKVSTLVIVTPQPPSHQIFRKLAPNMAADGECFLFLGAQNQAIAALPLRSRWKVSNFIPEDPVIGLHGKLLYAEWMDGDRVGSLLYVGSANFTLAAYSDKNVESGVLVKAVGTNQVAAQQRALAALLGRTGSPSKARAAWATERFDGRWRKVDAPKSGSPLPAYHGLSKEDVARSQFTDALKADNNRLTFPPRFGETKILRAALMLSGGDTRYWSGKGKRVFSGVVWAPTAAMKLRLQGGRDLTVYIPPLEGLMAGTEQGAGLVEVLLSPSATSSEGTGGTHGPPSLLGNASIYSDARVLFPWRRLIHGGHGSLLRDKHQLKRAGDAISGMLREGELKQAIKRKLEIINFSIRCMLKGSK